MRQPVRSQARRMRRDGEWILRCAAGPNNLDGLKAARGAVGALDMGCERPPRSSRGALRMAAGGDAHSPELKDDAAKTPAAREIDAQWDEFDAEGCGW